MQSAQDSFITCLLPPLAKTQAQEEYRHGSQHHPGAGGVDFGRYAKVHLAIKPHGQSGGTRSGDKAGNNQVVECQNEGQGPARQHTRQDKRKGDFPECLQIAGTEIC